MGDMLGVAWSDILIGILGGIVVSGFFVAVNFVRNKMLEHRYPVAGTYLTTFQDTVGGQSVSVSALAKLTQQGKHIKGETWLENDRKWILDGQLTDSGNLHGVYFADDPMDKGIGNFFLKVGNNHQMSGLWSGFDSENNMVTSGIYTFRPILDTYSIVDATRTHAPQIIAIANQQLGEGFLPTGELLAMLDARDIYICKTAVDGPTVLGFCLCRLISADELSNYLGVDHALLPRFVDVANKIGVIKTIATVQAVQGHGVGFKLAHAADKALLDAGVGAVLSPAWCNKDHINSDGVLRSIGLQPGALIPNFWATDSVANNYMCPACGTPPCHCTMMLYSKAV